MIRVAWPVPNTDVWIGGLNYFLNLGSALLSLSERHLEPVVMGNASGLPEPLGSLSFVPYASEARKYSSRWLLRRIERLFNLNGGPQARLFRKHDIKLFSHGWPLGSRSPVPALCWIPDFQHKHLPDMFSPHEIRSRDSTFSDVARRAQGVLLSSEDAKKDFCHFYPGASDKAHVLRFMASPLDGGGDEKAVLAKLRIEEPFFHIPNQLWKHKNHGVILEAMRLLQDVGRCPLVISTGQNSDYRHPGYFESLRRRVDDAGLTERFRFLGLIDFVQVDALMRGAAAMINPSRFEGWSTTVEEAKSLGKRILLSDIPVHREQAPERGMYFGLDDANALAGLMLRVLESHSTAEEREAARKAESTLPARRAAFARNYEDIVFKFLQP